MTKNEIITATEKIVNRLSSTCNGLDDTLLFKSPGNKWSVAENVQHLVLSTNMTSLAYRLPRFMVKWMAGKPNRNSRTFDELKDKYYNKLSQGGTASTPFVPKPIEITYGKEKLLANWRKSTTTYLTALKKNRTEKDLDSYLVKHPLLGRITLRELCYFTIFHTEHHLQAIQKISSTT